MNKLEEINIKIEANKEVLATLPQNNEKNINIYIQKVNSLQEEFKEYEKQILKEMEIRAEKIDKIKENPELVTIKQELHNTESILYLLNDVKTSFEKMNFDIAMHNLRYYYRKNLEVVNETILRCIKKFKEVGVALNLEDFCHSKYVREYLTIFFEEIKNDNVDFKKIQSKFEEIYWECSNLIIYIETNLRYLYLNNEKNIDKYYSRQQEKILEKCTVEDILNRYMKLKKQLIEKTSEDKYTIVNDFIEGKLNAKDYSNRAIEERYSKFISKDVLENADENKLNEIDSNIKQLSNSIYEYKNYLKFKFIIDNVKKIYEERDKYKNVYAQTKKEIAIKEKEIIKLNNKVKSKGIFKKSNDKLLNEQERLILEVKELYRQLDKNKIYDTVLTKLSGNPTISDALSLASSFYNYLVDCIRDGNKDISEEELEKTIIELREFIKWPYSTIINNIGLLEDKDLLLMIKDRYQLLNINISKEDLDTDNLDALMLISRNIEINHSIRKNEIDVEEIGYICEFKKILNNR